MKKNVKILSIVLIAITILLVASNMVYAVKPGDIKEDTTIGASEMTDLAGKILGGLRIFGTLGAVIILAILGIKYMTASPEGKADYKANMVPYIVGAVLLFGATNIASMVYDALT